MEIVLTTPLYPPEIGGPATYTKAVEREMKRRGHSVRIVKFSDVKYLPTGVRHVVFFWKTLRAIRGADIVFAQDIFSVGLPTLFAAKILRKKFLVRVPGDFAWEQGVQRFGVQDSIDVFQDKNYGWQVELMRRLQKFVVRSADTVITPSTYFKKLVSRWVSNPEKIVRVYNGLEDAGDISVKQFPQKTLVAAGRLVPWKGFDTLISFVKNTEYNLVIAGSGQDKDRLESLIKELDMADRVDLVGDLDKSTLLSYIKGSYAFVLPSTFESFSFQLVEALSVGASCIAFDIGNLSEIITHKENGYLVPVNDWEEVRKSLDSINENSDSISKQAVYSSGKFSITNTVDNLIQVFDIQDTVLMISTDRNALDTNSSVFGRLKDYANKLDRLDVVVLSSRGFDPVSDGNLHIHPTNSRNSVFRVFNAISIVSKLRGVRAVTSQDPFETGLVAVLTSWGKKYQVQIHTDLYSKYFATNILNIIRVCISWFVLLRANSIRVVSERIRVSLPWYVKHKKVTVLPIYTELSNQQKTTELSSPVIILTVSRLEKEKNIETLIQAMQYLDNVVLHIVGSGSLLDYLKNTANKLNVGGKVVFHGFQKKLEDFYQSADIYAQASLYEGFGLSLVEAASYGIPIVSTDVGVVTYELSEGVLVCPQKDPKAFADAISRLLIDNQFRISHANQVIKSSRTISNSYEEYLEKYVNILK